MEDGERGREGGGGRLLTERNGMGKRREQGGGGGDGWEGREEAGGRKGEGGERRGEAAAVKLVVYLLLVVSVGSIFSLVMVPSLRDMLRHVDNYVTATCRGKAPRE